MKLAELLLRLAWNTHVIIRVLKPDGLDLLYDGIYADMSLQFIYSISEYYEYDCEFNVFSDHISILLSKD